jgi:hypothetical protein
MQYCSEHCMTVIVYMLLNPVADPWGGREVDRPPARSPKKRREEKKEVKEEEKGEEKENGKNISIFVYSAFLFTWVDPKLCSAR